MTTAAQLKRKRQRERQNVAAFAALLSAPATGSVVIPADGMFAIVTPAAHVAGNALTVVGPLNRTIGVPAMAAGEQRLIGKLERGSTVTLAAWADLHLDTGLGTYRKIRRGS
jgi:hypothetical protein